MNSKERMLRAMRHQEPDRVPVMCQLALGHYFLNMKDKYKPHEIWFTSEGFADALVTLQQRYRFDGILINIPGRDPDLLKQVDTIAEDIDGEFITWKDGRTTFIPWDDNAQYEQRDRSLEPLPIFDDFDPDKDMDNLNLLKRYNWGVYHTPFHPDEEIPDYFFNTIDRVKAGTGGTVSIHGEVFSPFTHFMELFSYEEALIALMTDPAKVEAVLERLTQTSVAWALAQAGRGVDAVLISSAFAGSGFISPTMYGQFVVPYERQVADAVHAAYPDIPVYTHTCGRLGDRLELMIDSHVDGVDTLDPPPLGDTELNEAKERIGEKLFIKGNMNSVKVLMDTHDEFVDHAVQTIEWGKPGGGYILSSACSVAPAAEPWKMEMLVDLAEEHGAY